MQSNDLKLSFKRKARKTVGRGGKKGTYCGRGGKGQTARSGAHVNPLFEGGRSTLIDRMKKIRGFKSIQKKPAIVNLENLEKKFRAGETVSRETLLQKKLIKKLEAENGIKILGTGTLKKKLTIDKNIALSASAKESVEKAGGKVSA